MPLESTAFLLRRAREGDQPARERLARAYLPVLKRIAHGRLPASTRGLLETDDLVQITLSQAFLHLDRFEPRHEGAFLAYLRQILINRVRDEIRRARVRPAGVSLVDEVPSPDRSPLEEALGRDILERYEAALERLTPEQRQAVVLRIEMGLTHDAIAEAMDAPSADAARMAVARALVKLSSFMREESSRVA